MDLREDDSGFMERFDSYIDELTEGLGHVLLRHNAPVLIGGLRLYGFIPDSPFTSPFSRPSEPIHI